jgi:hypothetical protein
LATLTADLELSLDGRAEVASEAGWVATGCAGVGEVMEISGAGAGALAILPAIAAGDWCCTGTIA